MRILCWLLLFWAVPGPFVVKLSGQARPDSNSGWKRYAEPLQRSPEHNEVERGMPDNFSHRHDSHKHDVRIPGTYPVPKGYSLAYGWESIRILPVERVKKALETGLREERLLFPDERIKFIQETWEEVRYKSATRHLFVMDQNGRIRLLNEGEESDFIGTVVPKGRWRKLGEFVGKKVALPALKAAGMSLVYLPVSRLIGGGLLSSGGNTEGGSCHMDGDAVHCGEH